MNRFFLFIIALSFFINQSIQDTSSFDMSLIREYFKYKVNEAIDFTVVFPVKENDLSYNIKTKKKIESPTTILTIQRNDIYSTSTIYPLFDKIILGLMDFFQVPLRPNMIKDNFGNSQITFYSLQWVYQMLFLKYSSQYYTSQVQVDSSYAQFYEFQYGLSAKFTSASQEDIEFINFAIEYGKNIASPLLVKDTNDKLNEILNKFNLKSDKYFHLLEVHSYLQQFFSKRFPYSGYDIFINDETYNEFKFLLVYILNESILYNTSNILALNSKEDNSIITDYLSLVDPDSMLTLYSLWTSPSLQVLRKIPMCFNIAIPDIKTDKEFDSLKVLIEGIKKDEIVKLTIYDQVSLEDVYYKGNSNILSYSNNITFKKAVSLSLKYLLTDDNFKAFKYMLPVFKNHLNDFAEFSLTIKELDFNLLSYVRIGLLKSNIDHKIIHFQLLQNQKMLSIPNEIKSLLKYNNIIEKELSQRELTGIDYNLRLVMGDLLIVERYKVKLFLKQSEITLIQNSLMMIICNKIVENKQKLLSLLRLKSVALKERIKEIKYKLIN